MGLEDVEAAADLVQEAAHPDANIIFGASFDESMEDEIRVTVIATGFDSGSGKLRPSDRMPSVQARPAAVEEAPVEPVVPAASAAPAAGPSVPPVFKPASDMKPVVPGAAPAAAPEEDPEKKPEEDPFDNIFKIFNTK
jgi:cell division protein FtsZ